MLSSVVLKFAETRFTWGACFKTQTPEEIPCNSDSVDLGCRPEICHDSQAGVPWDPA